MESNRTQTMTNAELLAAEPLYLWLVPNPQLPADAYDVAEGFRRLAAHLIENVPRDPERTMALRKLLEGKDAAVRAVIAGRVG